MSKQITVIRVSTSTPAGKNYELVELAYKTDDGKTKGMKIFGFGPQKAVADAFKTAQAGDVFDVEFEQSDRGYWQFREAKNTGVKAAESGKGEKPATPVKGNWETTEERAARQVLIVRQSSLSSAVDFLVNAGGKAPTKESIVEVAKYFEGYVFDKNPKEIE